MMERQRKNELLGRIRAHYARMGEAEPFGLAAASIETIEDHFEKCQGDAAKRAKADGKKRAQASRISNIARGETKSDRSGPASSRELIFEPKALGS